MKEREEYGRHDEIYYSSHLYSALHNNCTVTRGDGAKRIGAGRDTMGRVGDTVVGGGGVIDYFFSAALSAGV